MKNFRSNLRKALALTLLPPALVGGLYFWGSSTGCSGSDCTAAMMAVGLLGLAAIPVVMVGVTCLAGLALQALWHSARERFHRLGA